jgi:predicted transcriptional regulator
MLASDVNFINNPNNDNDKLKYRSKTDITAQILTAAKNKPLGKTKIMYSAMVSSQQMKEYLDELLRKELISYNEESRTYQTTEHVLEFIRLYEKIKSLGNVI